MSNPPSSPTRLPSPPPFPEIQTAPKSPSLGAQSDSTTHTMNATIIEANSRRRIHPGTKAADMAAGPPLVSLEELDSAFPLQEHLKALHYYHTKPPDADHTIPISREIAAIIATPPTGVHPSLWLYELCRFLINKCNELIVGFLFDEPACSSTTCPEMRASEWQFLCAVHESPKSCCAIDYCCHTLDWATNMVTSQMHFPNRITTEAGGDMGERREAGLRHLVNIFRRLHRIFAHAWFQHQGVFWQIEGQTGLYVLFKTVCDMHQTLPPENFKLPPEAEGLEQIPEPKHMVSSILRPEKSNNSNHAPETVSPDMYMSIGRTNTKRHIRSSPSTGSAVTTVLETDEADDDHSGLDEIFLSRQSTLPIMREPEPDEEDWKGGSEIQMPPKAELEPAPVVGTEVSEALSKELHEELPKVEDAESLPANHTAEKSQSSVTSPGKSVPMPIEEPDDEVPKFNNLSTKAPASPENLAVEQVDGTQAEEKNVDQEVEGNGLPDDDLGEVDELELEAFEELPIPQIQQEAPMPGLQREETLKPVKPDEKEVTPEDPKISSQSDESPEEKVTVADVPDDEEKPVSDVS